MSINLKAIDRDTLYSTTEASKLLQISPGTLCNLRVAGEPPEYIRAGGRIWYPGKSLLKRLAGAQA